MLSLHRTLSLRYLSRRWFRAALIVASIMLGVATLVATQALSDTMSKATLAIGNPLAGKLDFMVVNTNADLPVDGALASELLSAPGVKSVHKRVFGHVRVLAGGKKQQILVLGVDVGGDDAMADEFEGQIEIDAEAKKLLDAKGDKVSPRPTGGEGPGVRGSGVDLKAMRKDFDGSFLGMMPVILGKELDSAVSHDPALVNPLMKFLGADRLKLFACEKEQHKQVLVKIATVSPRPKSDLSVLGGQVIILGLSNAAKVLQFPEGTVRRFDIVLQPGADPKQVRSAIAAVLAGRAEVCTLEEQNHSLQSATSSMKAGFSLCGVAALIVGMFLVYNALSVSVAERRHEIGILLALGATRDQVWRLFAGEACFLGAIGAALGIPFGVGLANLGLKPMQTAVGDIYATGNLNQVELTWSLTGLAFAVGIVSSVVASLVPAIQAAYDKPAEAVRRIPKEPAVTRLVLHIAAVVIMIIIGVTLMFLREYLPERWGTFGGLSIVMIAALLSAPLLAQVAARALMPIARYLLPIEWRLAFDNLVRTPGRTGMVIGALAAGVCLIVETSGVIRSNREGIRAWVDTSIASDIVVTSGSPIGSGGQNESMRDALQEHLRRIDGVAEAIPCHQSYSMFFRNARVAITAVEAERLYLAEKDRHVRMELAEMFNKMKDQKNAVLISTNFAILHRVKVGDTISLKSPKGETDFEVMGIVVDYTWNLGTITMNRSYYIERWGDTRVTFFELYVAKGADADRVKADIKDKLADRFDLYPLTRTELKSHVDAMIERVYQIALSQEVVVVLVAALGVVMALLISVLQRKREMGLLRAIGASQGQVTYLVLAEACLMGVFGSVIGILLAAPLQWYALCVIIPEETGFTFDVRLAWKEGAMVAAMGIVIAVLAGLGPALYAVRERIPEAIAYE
jgi:putative ABC transport system permease protein